MKFLVFVFLTLFTLQANGQNISQKNLVRKWRLQKLILDGTVINSADVEALKRLAVKNLKRSNPQYTVQDSLDIIKKAKVYAKQLKKVYIKFKKDGTYETTTINGNGDVTKEKKYGTYQFDEKNQTIIEKEKDHTIEIKVSIVKKRLILKSDKGAHLTFEYK